MKSYAIVELNMCKSVSQSCYKTMGGEALHCKFPSTDA